MLAITQLRNQITVTKSRKSWLLPNWFAN